jgi:hypothetical protein
MSMFGPPLPDPSRTEKVILGVAVFAVVAFTFIGVIDMLMWIASHIMVGWR